jgi:hypothetical protein
MRVSFVVNNYNYARYLRDSVDSALAQDHHDVEVVVVDDGSADNSREVIAAYGERVVPVLKNNGGQGTALAAGFAASTGDAVIFVDADDRVESTLASTTAQMFAASPRAVLAQFRLRVCDAMLRPLGTVVPPAYVALPAGDVRCDVARWTLASGLGPGGAVAFRRTVLDAMFPLPPTLSGHGADTYLLRGAALLGDVVSRDIVVGDYRSHGANDSNVSELDVGYLQAAIQRQVDCCALLRELARKHGAPEPVDVLGAADPILLSQRITALRVSPQIHPIHEDTRLDLARRGLAAALARTDVAARYRLAHAAWFLVVAAAPRGVALRAATWLLFPLSRRR